MPLPLNFLEIGLKPGTEYSQAIIREIGKAFIEIFKIDIRGFTENPMVFINFGIFFIDKLHAAETFLPKKVVEAILLSRKNRNFMKTNIHHHLNKFWQSETPQDLKATNTLMQNNIDEYQTNLAKLFDYEDSTFQMRTCAVFEKVYSELSKANRIVITEENYINILGKIVANINDYDEQLRKTSKNETPINYHQLPLMVLLRPGFTLQDNDCNSERKWGLEILNHLLNNKLDYKINYTTALSLAKLYRNATSANSINILTLDIINTYFNNYLMKLIEIYQQEFFDLNIPEDELFFQCLNDIINPIPKDIITQKIASLRTILQIILPLQEKMYDSLTRLRNLIGTTEILTVKLETLNCDPEIISTLNSRQTSALSEVTENVEDIEDTQKNLQNMIDFYEFIEKQILPKESFNLFILADPLIRYYSDKYTELNIRYNKSCNLTEYAEISDELESATKELRQKRQFFLKKLSATNLSENDTNCKIHTAIIAIFDNVFDKKAYEFNEFKKKIKETIASLESKETETSVLPAMMETEDTMEIETTPSFH